MGSIVGTMGARFVYGLVDTDQTTPDLEIPSWVVYLATTSTPTWMPVRTP
jgi:hypothetical protein